MLWKAARRAGEDVGGTGGPGSCEHLGVVGATRQKRSGSGSPATMRAVPIWSTRSQMERGHRVRTSKDWSATPTPAASSGSSPRCATVSGSPNSRPTWFEYDLRDTGGGRSGRNIEASKVAVTTDGLSISSGCRRSTPEPLLETSKPVRHAGRLPQTHALAVCQTPMSRPRRAPVRVSSVARSFVTVAMA